MLPPYSPELDPAERWFQEFRRKLSNRTFESVAVLHEALTRTLLPYWGRARPPETAHRILMVGGGGGGVMTSIARNGITIPDPYTFRAIFVRDLADPV